jgi:hypothetical protein
MSLRQSKKQATRVVRKTDEMSVVSKNSLACIGRARPQRISTVKHDKAHAEAQRPSLLRRAWCFITTGHNPQEWTHTKISRCKRCGLEGGRGFG